jgi:hypothetical protein
MDYGAAITHVKFLAQALSGLLTHLATA